MEGKRTVKLRGRSQRGMNDGWLSDGRRRSPLIYFERDSPISKPVETSNRLARLPPKRALQAT